MYNYSPKNKLSYEEFREVLFNQININVIRINLDNLNSILSDTTKKNILISVNESEISDSDFIEKSKEVKEKFDKRDIYFSQEVPYSMPKNSFGEELPSPNNVFAIHVIGSHLGKDINSQVKFLNAAGYDKKISVIEELVL